MDKAPKTMKNYEDEYIKPLLHDLNDHIMIVGDTELFDSEGRVKETYKKINIKELAKYKQHFYLKSVIGI